MRKIVGDRTTGDHYLRKKEYQTAIKYYNLALSKNPKDYKALKGKGKALNELKKFKEAYECFNKALEIYNIDEGSKKGKIDSLLGLGYEHLDNDYFSQAFTCFQEVLDINHKNSSNFLKSQASKEFIRGKTSDILAGYFDEFLGIKKGDLHALNGIGWALIGLEEYRDSIDYFDRVLRIRSTDIDALLGKGEAFLQLEEYDLASLVFNNILKLEPQNLDVLKLQSQLSFELEDYNEALGCFNRILDFEKFNQEAEEGKKKCLIHLGDMSLKRREYHQALAYYQDYLLLDGGNQHVLMGKIESLWDIITELMDSNEFTQAIIKVEDALDSCGILMESNISPDEKSDIELLIDEFTKLKFKSLLEQGKIYLQGKNLGKASQSFQDAYKITPHELASSGIRKALLGLGNQSLGAQNYTEGLDYFQKILEICPNDYDTLIGKTFAYNGLRQYNECLELCNELLKVNESDDRVLYCKKVALSGLGCKYLDDGHFKEALNYFHQALTIASDDLKSLTGNGLALNGLKNFDDALELFNLVLKDENNNSHALTGKLNSLIGQGNNFLQDKNFDSALNKFKSASTIDPHNLEVLNGKVHSQIGIGNSLLTKNQYSDALNNFNQALKIEPKNEEALSGKVISLVGLGDNELNNKNYKNAIDFYEKAQEIEPGNKKALKGKSKICVYQANQELMDGDPNKAINLFDKALQYHPHNEDAKRGRFNALILLGENLLKTNNFDDSLQNFNEALKIRNSKEAVDGKVKSLIGKVNKLAESHNYQAALNLYNEVLTITPENFTAKEGRIEILSILAQKNLQNQNYSAALEQYQIIHQEKPDDLTTLYGIAYSLEGLNHFKSSLESYKHILELKPHETKANDGMFRVLLAIGQKLLDENELDNAFIYFQDALDINFNHKDALLGKALVLNGLENYKKALEIFDYYLTNYPDDPKALRGKTVSLLGLAKYFLEINDYHSALREFSLLLSLDSHNVDALNGKILSHIGLGNVHLKSNRFDAGHHEFMEALKIQPNNTSALSGKAYTLVGMGNFQLKNQLFDKSLQTFTKALECNPKLPEAIDGKFKSLLGKGYVYLNKSDYESALKLFNESYSLHTDDPDVKKGKIASLIGIANQYLEANDFESALIEFNEILEIDGENFQAKSGKTESFIGLGNYYLKNGNFPKSLRYFQDAIKIDPHNNEVISGLVKSLIARGNYQLKNNLFEDALKSYQQVIEIDYENTEAWDGKFKSLIGKAQQSLDYHDLNSALEFYNHALKIKYDKNTLKSKILILIDLEKFEEALPLINNLLLTFTDDPELLKAKSRALTCKGNKILEKKSFQQALNEFENSLKIDPENKEACNGKVLCVIGIGDEELQKMEFSKALHYYEFALSLDPINNIAKSKKIEALNLIANQQFESNEFKKAFETYKKVLKIDLDNQTATGGKIKVLTTCGIAFLEKGDYLTSINCFNLVLCEFPHDHNVLNHKSNALTHTGNDLLKDKKYTSALKIFNDALEISENKDAFQGKLLALKGVGDQWVKTGDLKKALHCYQQILDMDKNNPNGINGKTNVELLIGYRNLEKKNFKKARSNFKEVLKQDKNNLKGLLGCLKTLSHLNQYHHLLKTSEKILEIDPENSPAKKQEINAHFHIAQEFYSKKKYSSAIDHFVFVLERDSKNFDALIGKAFALEKLSDFENAIKLFNECLEINKESSDAIKGKLNSLISWGNQYLEDLKFKVALEKFETALKIDSSNIHVINGKKSSLLGIGTLHLEKGENQLAIDNFINVLEIDPESLRANLGMGIAKLDLSNYQESNKYFENALKIDPTNSKALKGKVSSLIKIGFGELDNARYNEALKSFENVLQIASQNQEALEGKKNSLLCLANDNFLQSDFENALILYLDVLKIEPNNKKALKGQTNSILAIANDFLKSKNYHKAYNYFRDVFAINKDNQEAEKGIVISLTSLAKEYQKENDIDSALKFFNEILTIEPTNSIACKEKHNILIIKGNQALEINKYNDALRYFDESSYIHDFDSVRGKALCLYGLGRFKESISLLDEALKEEPENTELIWKKILSLYQIKSLEEALQLIEKFLDIENNNTDALVLKGRILFDSGRNVMALIELNKAIDLNSEIFEAFVLKGEIYCDIGHYDKALECFEQALELDSENREIILKIKQVESLLNEPDDIKGSDNEISPKIAPIDPISKIDSFTEPLMYSGSSLAFLKKIAQIQFGILSPDDIRKMSSTKIVTPDTYDEKGYSIEEGLMDPRMGVVDPGLRCRTCGSKGGDCQGHFGHINLARPIVHVGFADTIHKILRSTCIECGRVLLTETERIDYHERIKSRLHNKESITGLVKDVYTTARRDKCPHCDTEQEDITINKPVSLIEGNYKLTPSEVRERLEKITEEDYIFFGINSEIARLEWMVLTVLPVSPITVRPTIIEEKTGQRIEDDLTHKLVDILRINQRLKENMESSAPQLIVEDLWELLQYHVTTYFDNEDIGIPPARHRSGRPLITLMQRLNGKEGRFRKNLSSKRVNFSARSVLAPDPNISINDVGVPQMIATELTVPIHVTEWNLSLMKRYILNGPEKHPGANYVIRPDGRKIRVYDETKQAVSEKLEPGFIVERHLIDGDIVLVNRQPSLHKLSIMAHEVKVFPQKTITLNPAVCPPYNADFDGDEINIHVIQTEEARAEAKNLMAVQENIISPRFGAPIIGGVSDHISGAYLLTRERSTFNEDQVLQMLKNSDLPLPSTRKKEWTGKEIFSILLPEDLNLTFQAEICRSCDECLFEACKNDSYVIIEKGQLKSGVIDKAALGAFSGKILDSIVKEYGNERAQEFLDSTTKLAISAIMKRGFTTSTTDVEISQEANDHIKELLSKAEEKVEMLIETCHYDELEALPGRSPRENLEIKIMQVLSEARNKSGKIAESYFGMNNNSVIMALTGAKGSLLNITQNSACLGQQSIRGGRIDKGYSKKTLPHFNEGDISVKTKGFVRSSYKTGLDPLEFFFHAMGGRDAQVNSSVRTSQSGYMQRRLVYALQDLFVHSDGTVRDNRGVIIQTLYGEDGIDPANSNYGKIVNIDKLIEDIRMKPIHSEPLYKLVKRQINNIGFDHYFFNYYQTKERYGLNQNKFSKNLLLFKNVNSYHYKNVADEFSQQVIDIIESNNLNFDVIIPIPSSTKEHISEGSARLAANLSKSLRIENGTGWLERIKTVPKSHIAGSRTIEQHLNSIYCKDNLIDKNVLLFDDIYTHGNTAKSCILKINENYKANITLITLGKTPTKE